MSTKREKNFRVNMKRHLYAVEIIRNEPKIHT